MTEADLPSQRAGHEFRGLVNKPSTRTPEEERKQLDRALNADYKLTGLFAESQQPVWQLAFSEHPLKLTPESQQGVRQVIFSREMDLADRSPEDAQDAWERVAGWRATEQHQDQEQGERTIKEDKIEHDSVDPWLDNSDGFYGKPLPPEGPSASEWFDAGEDTFK